MRRPTPPRSSPSTASRTRTARSCAAWAASSPSRTTRSPAANQHRCQPSRPSKPVPTGLVWLLGLLTDGAPGSWTVTPRIARVTVHDNAPASLVVALGVVVEAVQADRDADDQRVVL